MLGDERRQRLGVEAVLVARHRLQARAREAEGLQRGEVGRVLDEDDVARVEQDRGEQARAPAGSPS